MNFHQNIPPNTPMKWYNWLIAIGVVVLVIGVFFYTAPEIAKEASKQCAECTTLLT